MALSVSNDLAYRPSEGSRNSLLEDFLRDWLYQLFQSSQMRKSYVKTSIQQLRAFRPSSVKDVAKARHVDDSTKHRPQGSEDRSRSPCRKRETSQSLSSSSKTQEARLGSHGDSTDLQSMETFQDLLEEELTDFFRQTRVRQAFALMCLKKLEDMEKNRKL